jgi:signal transduction histidine kinase
MRSALANLKQQVDGVMEELHRLSANLRPVTLEKLGLIAAVRQLLDDAARQCGLRTDLVVVGLSDQERLAPEVETTAYRIAQESLTNVMRHAQAGRVAVLIQRQDGQLRVIVEDDARGFDVEAAASRGRLGLLGMRERVALLGGELEIESGPASGTTLIASLPLPLANPAE